MSELRKHLQNVQQTHNEKLLIRPDFVFHDNVANQLDADSSTDQQGRRHYTISNGVKLPSVTTVLGQTKSEKDKKALENWRKRVGEEEATKITKDAAIRGGKLHALCENFILDQKFTLPVHGSNDYHLWRQMHPLLNKVNNIRQLEGALYSEKLGIAGRVDCVAEFDGVLSIIDFKTARKQRKEEWLTDYYCQETAYALMYSEMFGEKVTQIVTLMSIDGNTTDEGHIFIKKPVDYVELLLKRIKMYKTMNK